jgi:hypothetical protein
MYCADDQTGHLLWRLKNGELPRRHAPRVIVLLAGTTDVKLAHAARGEDGIIDAADGIAARCCLPAGIVVSRLRRWSEYQKSVPSAPRRASLRL